MKKAFVSILLAVGVLSACSNQNIEIDHPTTPPTETVQEATEATEALPAKVNVSVPVESTEPTAQKATEPIPVDQVSKEDEPIPEAVPKAETAAVVNKAMESTVPTEPVIKETVPAPIQELEHVSTKPVPQETVPPITEPPATEPPVTEPAAEPLNLAELEDHGRSYAFDTYGYNGTAECTPETEAGNFPSSTTTITSMEEGKRIIQEAINNLHENDEAHGYAAYEEVDGETVRCPVNVQLTPTGEPNEYTITVYYGGTS